MIVAMAERIQLIDDLDGQPIPDGSTVRFSLDDDVYEIDLSIKNRARLRAAFEPYVSAVRRTTYRTTSLPPAGPKQTKRKLL